MIIDAHTHVWLRGNTEKWDLFIRECQKNQVSLAIVSCLDAEERFPPPETVHSANITAQQFAAYSRGLVRWLAYINPQNTNWREEIETCQANGAIGIKLWVSLKDSRGSLKPAEAVLIYASLKKLPVLIHVFNRTDPNLPGELDIEEFAALAESFPEAILIAAHAGANWRYSLGVLRNRAPNAFVDVCGCYPQPQMIEKLIDDIGVDRILFGSDMFGRSLPSQIAKVAFAEISEADKIKIFRENAIRAYRLETAPNFSGTLTGSQPPAAFTETGEDHFCFCGQWPFFETRCQTPVELDALLAANQIRTAFTADLGSIYRFDLEAANNAFLRASANCKRIVPLAVVNPLAHHWRRTIENLAAGFAGAIVFPFLHGWKLDTQAELFQKLAAQKIPVWINLALDDYRFRHSGQNCRNVSEAEIRAFCETAPQNSWVFQGIEPAQFKFLRQQKNQFFRFEISRFTDRTGELSRALKSAPRENFVLGSEFPFRDIREVRWAAARELA